MIPATRSEAWGSVTDAVTEQEDWGSVTDGATSFEDWNPTETPPPTGLQGHVRGTVTAGAVVAGGLSAGVVVDGRQAANKEE